MKNSFISLRLWFVKHYIATGFIISLLFFVSMQLFMTVFSPKSITITAVTYISIYLFLLSIGTTLYFGLRGSEIFKSRMGDLLTFVSTLRRGKFSERIEVKENDDIGLIAHELNDLASYIEDQVASLQRLADENATLAEQAHSAAVLEERQRLARDLHDSVSQQLFALGMLSSATLRLIDIDAKQAKKQLEEIAEIASKAQGEMRALLLHLRPVDLSNDSLSDGLIKLLRELKEKTNLQFDASIDEIDALSKAQEEHLFRIVQEALSNILRHSDANLVKVSMTEKEQYVHLFIGDNGKGFNLMEDKLTSYGLKTMRERCEEIGGIFNIRSKINEGTYIDIRVPLKGRK